MEFHQLAAPALLEALPDPAVVIDVDGWILRGNRTANDLLATNRTPAGANVVDFLPEHERSRLNPLVWLRRWGDEPQAPELAHVRLWCRDANGVDKPVRVRVGRLPTDPCSYLVILVDVTEEQARQYRTRSAHRLAARVMAVSADAIVHVDERGLIIYANPSAEALFEYPAGALVGEPLANLLPERFRRAHEAFMREFAVAPVPSRMLDERAEIRGLTRSGEEIPLAASITKVTTDRGLVFSANLRDLRPQYAARAELARSEARFRTVFEHARQAMALIAPDGRVQAMNPAGRRLLQDDVEPVGAPFAEVPYRTADPAATAAALRRALERAFAGEPYRAGVRVVLPDTGERQLDFTLSPVVSGGNPFAVIAEAHEFPDGPE